MSDYQLIGHCKTCKGQWVIGDPKSLGKKLSFVDGRRCPYCKSNNIYTEKEDTR